MRRENTLVSIPTSAVFNKQFGYQEDLEIKKIEI